MTAIRSEAEIKQDIENELYWDSRVEAAGIDVDVKNARATLRGEVGSYRERAAARSAARRIPGVVDVNDELTIRYLSTPPLPTDTELETRIRDILSWEPTIDSSSMTVTVAGGVITLEGTVDAHWKKAYAESRVSGLRGVMGVENKLAVVPTGDLADELVAEDIVGALDRDSLVNADCVTVAVNGGIARLSGEVPSWVSRDAAEEDASYTAGVVDVQNDLQIATPQPGMAR